MTGSDQGYPWPVERVLENARTYRQAEVRGHWATRALLAPLLWCVRRMSWETAWWFGALIGRLLRALRIRRDVAMTNLDIAFGDRKTAAEKEAIYRAAMLNVGHVAVAYMRLPWVADQHFWDVDFEAEGMELAQRAFARGKGILFIGGHIGMWEIAGAKMSMSGYPTITIGKRIANPVVDKIIVDGRQLMGLGTIPHRDSMPVVRDALARNQALITVADENMRRSQGMFVQWFGHTASTPKSTPWLVRETGAALICGHAVQTGPRKFKLFLTEEVPWQSVPGDPDRELQVNAQAQVDAVERVIAAKPEEWFWLHRRWKTQPEGVPNPYDKKKK